MRNENWAGDFNGETWPDRAERITFRVIADPDTSYNAPRSGRDRHRPDPAGASGGSALELGQHARREHPRLVPLHHQPGDPRVGGDENLLLRQAISMAIDREAINQSVYNGLRTVSTGVTPQVFPASPRASATTARTTRRAGGVRRVAGGRQRAADDPDPVQLRRRPRAGGGDLHRQPGGDRHRGRSRSANHGDLLLRARRRGVRDLPRRVVRRLPDVRQLHVRPVPHRVDRLQQLRRGQQSRVRRRRRRGEANDRPGGPGALFQEAEDILLNQVVNVIPINWYLGDYAFNTEALRRASPSRRSA